RRVELEVELGRRLEADGDGQAERDRRGHRRVLLERDLELAARRDEGQLVGRVVLDLRAEAERAQALADEIVPELRAGDRLELAVQRAAHERVADGGVDRALRLELLEREAVED